MGHYTHMHGTAKIKLEYADSFRAFLETARDSDEGLIWSDFDISDKENIGYKLLCHNNIGHWTPFGLSDSRRPFDDYLDAEHGFAEVDEAGTLTFLCGFKNYDKQQEAFIVVLSEIATEWSCEQCYVDSDYYLSPKDYFNSGDSKSLERAKQLTESAYRKNDKRILIIDGASVNIGGYRVEYDHPQYDQIPKSKSRLAPSLSMSMSVSEKTSSLMAQLVQDSQRDSTYGRKESKAPSTKKAKRKQQAASRRKNRK